MSVAIRPSTDALIVVDVQTDFCPGGALAVPQGDEVVPVINGLLHLTNWLTIATRDWHPADHCSFTAQGGPWPPHCVAETVGAGFHPELDLGAVRHVISKATSQAQDAYSGFQGTDLERLLRAEKIQRVFVCGLATDYCVKATALDARRSGFDTAVVTDAIRAVEVHPGDCAAAVEAMRAAGVILVQSKELQPPA